jgi:S-DNA-T family DNA segregation ATPase FtsK/SpoIIIE
MFTYGNIKLFFIKFTFGLIFLFFSIFLYGSLYSHSLNDPGFGIVNNPAMINNWGGAFGAYVASILLFLFDFSAYVMPTFFFIMGIKFILGIPSKLILLKFLFILLGIILFNLSLFMLKINSGIIGSFAFDLLNSFSWDYLNIDIFFWFFLIFISLLSLLLICLGLDIQTKYIIKLTKIFPFIVYVAYIFKPFLFIWHLIRRKIRKTKKLNGMINNNLSKKTEPTLNNKNNYIASLNTKSIHTNKNLHYVLPSINLLISSNEKSNIFKETEKRNLQFSKRLETILEEYGVEGKIVNYKYGPVVTLFEFLPAAGIKTSKVVGLSEDIARAMSSVSTRISSQPGKTSIGIEIPNNKREEVLLGDLIKDEKFSSNKNGLTLALGKNISGEKKFTDLEKMPHLLIAGTTGSGKSVGINSMIMSLLFRFTPSECKLILIDPKMLELSIYEDIPHLLTPVVTNPNKAVFALKWVVREMENRYRLMSSLNVKNIQSFNIKIVSALSSGRKIYREVQTGIDNNTRMPIIEKKEIPLEKMPLIVVVIDEMADLMMVAGKEVESLVQRLAQMARASGIHLIAATQRPSVDVITGTIKANFPSRISFRVASRFDSRTILNEMGAEQLLGSGDMLFLENGANLNRLHGGYVSEKEIENVVNHIKSQSTFENKKDITLDDSNSINSTNLEFENKDVDELYDKALRIILEQQKVSTSFIQRYLQIGYNRAARIVEKMEEDGFISEPNNSGKRSVIRKNR